MAGWDKGGRAMEMTTMIKRYALALLMIWSAGASAYTLSFNPTDQNVAQGDKAYVDVLIAGVLPGGLGSYDFDVLYDPTILAFDSANDQFGLGFALGLGAFPDTGKVTLSDFSFELPGDLLSLQADSFLLLTLVFDTLSEGASGLDFDAITLGDVNGIPVNIAASDSGRVTVNPVPEAETWAMLLAGLGLVGVATRRRRG